MTQLARQFADHPEVRYGLTAMCVGFGMGGAVIWENPQHADRCGTERGDGRCAWRLRGVVESGRDDDRAVPRRAASPAPVRYVEVPGLAGELALVTLDNGEDHTKPTTFGPAGCSRWTRRWTRSRRTPPRWRRSR